MPAIRHNRQLRWLLALPMAWALALPIEAREGSPSLAFSTGTPLLAQASLPMDAEIPKEITALEQTARGFYERGDYQKALELMQRVMVWVNASLSKNAPYRASSQTWMGLLLNAVGRRQEALAPTEEALRIYRELAKTNPAYLPDVAMAVTNLGVRYSELGRRQEALAPTEDALKIFRGLAKTNPAYLGDLARSLNNLGNRYSELGRRQEALAPTEEAVQIRRELAKTNPAYLPDVAMALNNLGIRYSELGRRQEALAPTEEALKIYRGLAKTNPAYLGDLATSLNNLGYLQLELGQPEIARDAYEEALKLYRPLAANNRAFQEDLQRTQNNLDELNRKEGIRTGAKQVLAATNVNYLPQGDPLTPVKRAVVVLWPTFSGKNSGVGLLGTGFVVRRQGDRAWIATALHVVRDLESNALATKVEAELFTGPLPAGVVAPRVEVVLPSKESLKDGGADLIVLEIRGLPADVQPLPLSFSNPEGSLQVVGHPSEKPPWTVAIFKVLKLAPALLYLDGELNPGASGSPVLNGKGEVVGLVYRAATGGEADLKYVMAYRASAIANKLR